MECKLISIRNYVRVTIIITAIPVSQSNQIDKAKIEKSASENWKVRVTENPQSIDSIEKFHNPRIWIILMKESPNEAIEFGMIGQARVGYEKCALKRELSQAHGLVARKPIEYR